MRTLLVLWPAALLLAQDAPKEKASVSGRVISAVTKEPVKGATVMLRPEPGARETSTTSTDAEGNFAMKNLEAGRYRLEADRNGYTLARYGARTARGPAASVMLEDGKRLSGLEVQMQPYCVLAGRVTSPEGEPLSGVMVSAQRLEYSRGRRTLGPAGGAETDDQGNFRIWQLPPGRYYLSAVLRRYAHRGMVDRTAGKPVREIYATTWYPGTQDGAAATPVELRPGGRAEALNLTLIRTTAANVRGMVSGYDPAAVKGALSVMLLRFDRGALALTDMFSARADSAHGRFELSQVPAGTYWAMVNVRTGEQLHAMAEVQVGADDIDDLRLVLAPGTALKGTVRLDDGKPAAKAAATMRVGLVRRDMRASSANTVAPDGTFTLANVLPDEYDLELTNLPQDCYLKSARSGESDLLASGLNLRLGGVGSIELTLGTDAGAVEGAVLDAKQQPAVGATVVLIPEARYRKRADRFLNATTDQQGKYSFRGVAPGEYQLLAWDSVEQFAWFDPDFLKDYEKRAEKVTVGPKGREAVQLKLIAGDEAGSAK